MDEHYDTLEGFHAAKTRYCNELISDAQTEQEKGNTNMARFYRKLAAMNRTEYERITPAVEHLAEHGVGSILKHHSRDQWALFLIDTDEPSKFRATRFDVNGFISHASGDSLVDVAAITAEDGFLIPDLGGGRRVMSLPSFECGNRILAPLQDYNARKLTSADFHQKADAVRAEYADRLAH